MKIYPEDNRYIKEVFEGNEYDFVNHYPLVVDVGANIGTFSMWIYDHADKIYAIEPVGTNVMYLEKNITENKLTKIIVKQIALSDSSMVKPMITLGNPENGGWALNPSGDYNVTCQTLADFMRSEKIEYIDLLKLDTEGEEIKILQSPLFPKDKIGTIIGEYHGNRGSEVKQILESYGYKYIDMGSRFLARKK